jgi:hypothetical protein
MLGGEEPGSTMWRDAEVQAATLPGPSATPRLHYCPWARLPLQWVDGVGSKR